MTKSLKVVYVQVCALRCYYVVHISHGPHIIRSDSYWHRSVRIKYKEAEKMLYNHFYGAQVYLFEKKKTKNTEKINSFGKFFY